MSVSLGLADYQTDVKVLVELKVNKVLMSKHRRQDLSSSGHPGRAVLRAVSPP